MNNKLNIQIQEIDNGYLVITQPQQSALGTNVPPTCNFYRDMDAVTKKLVELDFANNSN